MDIQPLTLKHCQRVTINTGHIGPGDVTIDAPNPGPGNISVEAPPGTPLGPVPVPSGGPQVRHATDASVVVLHYMQDEGGTDTVDVQLSVM